MTLTNIEISDPRKIYFNVSATYKVDNDFIFKTDDIDDVDYVINSIRRKISELTKTIDMTIADIKVFYKPFDNENYLSWYVQIFLKNLSILPNFPQNI